DSSSYTVGQETPAVRRFNRGYTTKPKPKPYSLRPSTLAALPHLKPLTLPPPLCARKSPTPATQLKFSSTSTISPTTMLGPTSSPTASGLSSPPPGKRTPQPPVSHWSYQPAY
ncbi:hypothetical protein IWQ62_003127, partial [Dispira parvispora]